ncbi:ATP-binding protein [Cytobacillus sp. FJAT-54145]|uniref:histidine kinase n=1 Tax=Cytobacillus spartinae TaxID=3299023 RepID=A0ABW6KFG8_9BACI
MLLLEYIINLSIFSLMVSLPLVIGSYIKHKPLRQYRLWVSIYAGIVSIILILLSIQEQGYSYDIRYAPIILVFSYLGPIAGLVTGAISLCARLYMSGNWYPAIMGWATIMISFSVIHFYLRQVNPVKRSIVFFVTYVIVYIITVPILFQIFRDHPLFHLQYMIFVMLGVFIGILLIESYLKLYRIIQEKKRMEDHLAASESKYRLIAENTSDLILVMDKDRSATYYSPSHEWVLGYKIEELKNIELCQVIHPDEITMFKRNIKRMLNKHESYTMEFRLKHKGGQWIEFESRCMPVRGERNSIEHLVLISRDISERKKAEEILLQSEKLSIVGELAAGVAHEIRNPLTTIKGFIQLYKQENSSFAYNDLLLSELERIETITSELLSLGKPQAVQLNRTNVKDLIENTLELLSPQALMNNIEFNLTCEEPSIFLTCEQNQLKQVFLNIFKNAIEAMPDGGKIKIELKKLDNDCIISIQDYGCGIPEDLLPRLGEPFYSLKEKGTGLGLMICHKIIQQHQGSISYSSTLGEGTLVEIRLPLSK